MPGQLIEIDAAAGQETVSVSLDCHVQKYTEKFLYSPEIKNTSTPIAYFETSEASSETNLHIADLTHHIVANAQNYYSSDNNWKFLSGAQLASKSKHLLFTDKAAVGVNGETVPLFYKHRVPIGTKEVSISVTTSGNAADTDISYVFDERRGYIYVDKPNMYDKKTGSYRLIYITHSGDSDSGRELLNPIPATAEAGWEDVDIREFIEVDGQQVPNPNLGSIINAAYTRDGNGAEGDWLFTLHGGSSSWWYKSEALSGIKPLNPAGTDPEDPWYMAFTNGDFRSRHNILYRIAEWNQQPFSPSIPYIFAPHQKALWIDDNLLYMTRDFLAINPNEGRHLTIYVYDTSGAMKSAHTTDGRLIGEYADQEKNTTYTHGTIETWDNRSGIVGITEKLNPEHTYRATYHYESNNFEYRGLTLNPLHNPEVLEHSYYFYLIPNVVPNANAPLFGERSIHYLKLDDDDIIVACSQGTEGGNAYASFQEQNEDGTFNPDTMIGKSLEEFETLYVNDENNRYHSLCECSVANRALLEDALVLDVRREAGSLEDFESAISRQQKILHSRLGYGVDGQRLPMTNSIVVEAPISLLEEFGGEFTYDQVKDGIERFSSANTNVILKLIYKKPEISAAKVGNGIALSFTWEGPELTYKLYRKTSIRDWNYNDAGQQGEPISTLPTGLAPAVISYTDLDANLESGTTYYYSVRVVEDGVEYPYSDVVSIKA